MTINREDWLKALQDARAAPVPASEAITSGEFSELMGMSQWTAQRWLKQLVRLGMATRTTKLRRMSNGVVYPSAAFLLTKKHEVPHVHQPRRRRQSRTRRNHHSR